MNLCVVVAKGLLITSCCNNKILALKSFSLYILYSIDVTATLIIRINAFSIK